MDDRRESPNYLGNLRESEKAAHRLKQFWKEKGFSVDTWVVKETISKDNHIYSVRSNIYEKALKNIDTVRQV